jgi:hypothetical protein
VDRRDRALGDHALPGLTLLVVEKRTGTRRPAGEEIFGSVAVEANHPVSHDLQHDAADPSRLGPGRSIIDPRQGEKAPGLIRITRALAEARRPPALKSAQSDVESPVSRSAQYLV